MFSLLFNLSQNMSAPMIKVIIGPMFAGKITLLLANAAEAKQNGINCAMVKHAKDDRYYTEMVCTHDGESIPARRCANSSEIISTLREVDQVFIDEVHMFADIDDVATWVLENRKSMTAAGLHTTERLEGFSHVMKLLAKADRIIHLTAKCDFCGSEAPFVKRITPVVGGNMIGGKEAYRACCRQCHDAQFTIQI